MERVWKLGLTEARQRLLFVSSDLDLSSDSHHVHSVSLCRALARAGVSVHALALRPARNPVARSSGVSVSYLSGNGAKRLFQLVRAMSELRTGDVLFVRISTVALAVGLLLARWR